MKEVYYKNDFDCVLRLLDVDGREMGWPDFDWLTEAADVDITVRTLATAISLGRGDSPDDWREITDSEADAYREAQTAALDRLAAERRARIEAAANNPDMQP